MPATAPRRALPLLLIGLGAAAAAGGCQSAPTAPRAPLTEARAHDAAIRAEAEACAARFSAEIEQAAARIAAASDDREQRRAATAWAIRANEASLRSLECADPAASLIDLWLLATQFRAFAESPAAAAAWGDHQHATLEAALALEAEAHRLADERSASAAGEGAHRLIAHWAAENPLGPDLARPATAEFWSRYRREIDPGLAGPASAPDESAIVTEQLARQLALRAAMLLEDRSSPGEADRPVQGALGADAAQQRGDREHLDTLVADALNALDQQRAAALGEIAAIVEASSEDAFARTERLVNGVFWRAAALLGAAFLAVVVILFAAAPRRRRGVIGGAALVPRAVARPTGRPLTAGHA